MKPRLLDRLVKSKPNEQLAEITNAAAEDMVVTLNGRFQRNVNRAAEEVAREAQHMGSEVPEVTETMIESAKLCSFEFTGEVSPSPVGVTGEVTVRVNEQPTPAGSAPLVVGTIEYGNDVSHIPSIPTFRPVVDEQSLNAHRVLKQFKY
jgi:hypothetical protein